MPLVFSLSYSSSCLSVFSPGEVPDTREALLSAFKRLDQDISLEAQVMELTLLVFPFPPPFNTALRKSM